MGNNGDENLHILGGQGDTNEPPKEVTLTITLSIPDGVVKVTGPIHNKVLTYGMMERARDIIKDFSPKPKEKSRIFPAFGAFGKQGE